MSSEFRMFWVAYACRCRVRGMRSIEVQNPWRIGETDCLAGEDVPDGIASMPVDPRAADRCPDTQ